MDGITFAFVFFTLVFGASFPQEETVLEIPSSGSDESDADDEIQKIMNSDNE